jgi:hypothetical protein
MLSPDIGDLLHRFGKKFVKFQVILEADLDLWYIDVRNSRGHALLMFREPHP